MKSENLRLFGDLFWRRSLPNLVDATVADWVGTLESVARGPDAVSARFVPGHGKVGSSTDVLEFRAYLLELRATVTKHL